MRTFRLIVCFGLVAGLAGRAGAQSSITVASGYRTEFVANVIHHVTGTPVNQDSGDVITGFTVSPVGDIFASKTANVGEITRVYRVPTAYTAGSGGLQNVAAQGVEPLVTSLMVGAASGQTNIDIQGVAVDSGGTAYFADKLGHRIIAAEPDTDGDGFANRIRLFAEFAVLSSPGNLAIQMSNGLTGDLYVSDTLQTGERVIYSVTADRNHDGYADGWGRFAKFNVNLPQPSVPLGLAFELVGSGPSTRNLFVAHETVGLYKLLADSAPADGQTDGILQLTSAFKGSVAFQTSASGGGGTDLFVTRALLGNNSNIISKLTFRSNGSVDTFTDVATGFFGPVALAAGRRGDLFVVERQTGNIYRISQAGTQTVSVITTPGIGLVYSLPQLAAYANSLLPGIAQVYSGTYEDFVFGASVIISQNDRLVALPGQRMVFPGGRRLEIRGGLDAEGQNLNGFDLDSGEFSSQGYDVGFISLAGFQQETGRMGVSFGKPVGVGKNLAGHAFSAADAQAALLSGGRTIGVTFAYAVVSSADLAGGWEGILFNQQNQTSEMKKFTVRYANKAITYQELTANPQIRDDNLILEDGLIDSNHTGVYLNNTNPMIRRCVIQRNRILVVQSPGGGSSAAPDSGTGLFCTNIAVPLVVKTYIRRNDFNGVAILNSSRPRLGHPGELFVFRSTGQGNEGSNDFSGNVFNAVFCTTARLSLPKQYAQNNYWGTADINAIKAMIFDYLDNSIYSEVDFTRLLPTPPEIPLPITETPPPSGATAVDESTWSRYR